MGTGVPQKNLRGTCKIGLKIECVSAYNFGDSGSNVTKLYHATCREAGVFKWARFLGKARSLKFGRTKCGAIFDNFRVWSRISPERIDLSKIGKVIDQLQPLPRWAKKDGERWSTNKIVIGAHVDPPKLHYRETIFRPLGGAGPSNFNTHYRLTTDWGQYTVYANY